ncbi:hypothetical protein D0Z07_0369 [Hyphodiscus hymeniophilus]|uniref:2EXR domain-containing protein n=1 Tax=Hyphodiscus hymeniophilus TaxID=353542 RepID=A0A9P6VS10_9HELO|nr:hypothetical protein D0Z07_0369 [Hyphodiscus hymeniophilus]
MAKDTISLAVSTVQPQPQTTPRPRSVTKLRSTLSTAFSKRFPQFSSLPVEIRLLVWEAAFPSPRIHELHPCGKLQQGRLTFRSNASTPPVVLRVCRESREVALHHYALMDYDPSFPAKPVRKFYFDPRADTLFLNTLTALYMTLILLEEDSEDAPRLGIMKRWQNVAFDADRAHLVTLLSGLQGRAPRPQFQRVFPDLKSLTIAFDFTRKGKTRFRTSVWPGENGTNLVALKGDTSVLMALFEPIREDLKTEFGFDETGERNVDLRMANVKRKMLHSLAACDN